MLTDALQAPVCLLLMKQHRSLWRHLAFLSFQACGIGMLHMYGLQPATAHQPGDMLAKAACLSVPASCPVLPQRKGPRQSPQQQTALGWPVCRVCCRLSSRVTRRVWAALERWTGCQKEPTPGLHICSALRCMPLQHNLCVMQVLSWVRNNLEAPPCAVAAVICSSLWQGAAGRAMACPFCALLCSI